MSGRNTILNRNRLRRGAAVLEMTAVMFTLLVLAFGMVEAGYFLFIKHNMQAAAREGARAGIVPGSDTQAVNNAVAATLKAAGLDGVSYTTKITNTNDVAIDVATVPAGTAVKVSVSIKWGDVGVRPLGILSANKHVKGATVMRKEG
jgi:Flp pilus assembly protein TadG